MDVGIDPAGGHDLAFSSNHLGTGPDDNIDPRLNIGVSSLYRKLEELDIPKNLQEADAEARAATGM